MLQEVGLNRLGISQSDYDSITPDDFVFKNISDNGSNIKKA